jgi:hypothetical protein
MNALGTNQFDKRLSADETKEIQEMFAALKKADRDGCNRPLR